MKQRLITWMACPYCQKALDLTIKDKEGGEIKSGKLVCRQCRKIYPIVNFIPRFIKTDHYAQNFSFEWKKHRTTQLDSYNQSHLSRDTFLRKTGLSKKDLKGKLVLDAGCGMGRFSEIAADYGAEVIGVDLSFAIDAAQNNLKHRKNCHFIQADIFHLPFRPKTFEVIFSIGVLHHTLDTRKAFMALPPLLKANGKIAIWVYGLNTFRPYTYFGDFWRQITPRLPKKLLYYLCYFSLPAYYLYKIPHLGSLINVIFPFSTDPNWRWRILDTFDWYSPKYQWKHTYPEVIAWFKQARLKEVKILDYEAAVLGKK